MPASTRLPTCPVVLVLTATLCVAACTDPDAADTEAPDTDGMPTSSAAAGSDGSETGEPGSGDFPTSTDAQPPTGTDSDSSTGTATTTDDDGDTDTEDEPYCSNGVIDPGEECDDGLENSSDGACTLSCTKATCGDGLLWTGHETCDDGNDDNSDACVVGCVPASCGDGYLFVGAEECEPGEIDDNGEYACSMTCMWSPLVAAPRLVFLSSVMFYGDLSVHEPSLGDYSLSDFPDGGKTGVLLADARCQALAELGGLTKDGAPPFHAWLSDNNGTEISSAVDRLHPNASPELQAGYMLPGGPMLAINFEALSSGLMSAIAKDEAGQPIAGTPSVWSNTSVGGEALGLVDNMGDPTSCENWHSATFEHVGERGIATQAQPSWTQIAPVQHCSTPSQLYCFQAG